MRTGWSTPSVEDRQHRNEEPTALITAEYLIFLQTSFIQMTQLSSRRLLLGHDHSLKNRGTRLKCGLQAVVLAQE